MAKEKKKNPSLLDATQKENTGKATAIGTYLEAPGGGTPLAKGEKAPGGKNGPWVKANRKMQPRDAEGKFTYNSANNKTLKYGPSRGETIPPFLLGSKCLYAIKSKSSVVSDGKVYWAGLDMSYEEFIRECQEYRPESNIRQSMKSKTGKRSKEEKRDIASGERGFVDKGERFVFPDGDKSDFELSFKSTYQMNHRGKAFERNKIGRLKNRIFKGLRDKPKEETPTQKEETKSNFDANKAANNPQEFIKQNQQVFNEIAAIHPSFSSADFQNAFVAAIASGGIKDAEELKQVANALKEAMENDKK